MKFFNTAGVCFPDRHYMLPAEPRLPGARPLIDEGQYFVVHAPRQTGKTTTLTVLARTLTAEGRYAALYVTCEAGRAMGDDYLAAQHAILGDLHIRAEIDLPADLRPSPTPTAPDPSLLGATLGAWARTCPRPVVLLLDEIDALSGASLYSVLSQLRGGANQRPAAFPHSVAVCGLRDVRDYRTASGADPSRMGGGSPFNIRVASLRLGDFTADEVRELYAQHTTETGQPFTDQAVDRAYEYTQGQPWLVNALARTITHELKIPPPTPIEAAHVERARERLIQTRQTHLDSLADKLREPRVRRIIEPILAGTLTVTDDTYDDDVSYLRDLGLIAPRPPARVANPIYQEVIVRVLGARVEDQIIADPRSFVLPDGRLDFGRLLEQFTEFWAQNSEVLTKGTTYHEVAPQLVLMAFVNRIVNGGGFVDREYGLGHRRIDLLIRWPYRDTDGRPAWQREAIELKVWHPGGPDPTVEGLQQLDEYLQRLRLDRGTLIIFDRRPPSDALPPLPERVRFETTQTPSGRPVTLLHA